mmetsp:Transcript_24675/g.79794  ORF Transcript_24675/g.79794 Transcript_24675/m.79794 type:complete len:787 (+) Transcript_24675:227-2587(+)
MNAQERAVLRRAGVEAKTWCSGSHPRLKHVFQPLRLRCGLELRNRVVMGSMHTGLEEKRDGMAAMAQFYAERASGAGLIVTGGVAPNREGWVLPFSGKMTSAEEAAEHRAVTGAVHERGGKIAMQILHAGRYAYHPLAVGPTAKKAPINVFTPKQMSSRDVDRTVDDFARAAFFAKEAGYDGVEIMGSEGYLINEFLAPKTNDRSDEWGGRNRTRFPLEIVKRARRAVGATTGGKKKNEDPFAFIFRLSLLELVEDGFPFEEAVELAEALDVDVINTGVGWHEARVPTIATCVPRGAFVFATAKLKHRLSSSSLRRRTSHDDEEEGPVVALCATNRVNDVATADSLVKSGQTDLVSMARPFLADPDLVAKAWIGQEETTNTCIACNQACLDHTFKLLPVSCLVNPRAGHETDASLDLAPTDSPEKIAVVGAGVAGLACATALAARGHHVSLFEKSDKIGGQFNLAANVPGKEEFSETLRYFRTQLHKVDLRLNCAIEDDVSDLYDFQKVVVATGVVPRPLRLKRLDDEEEDDASSSKEEVSKPKPPRVRSYAEVLAAGADPCGHTVAVIGAGGIGFDVSEALVADGSENFYDEWGIDTETATVDASRPSAAPPKRKVYLLQRKNAPFGATLGKTTGWIRRLTLKHKNVDMINKCTYVGVARDGLVVQEGDTQQRRVLPVTDVVVCAGQLSNNALYDALKDDPKAPLAFVVGGAERAGELDAKRAIDQGFRLAANIDTASQGDVFTMPTGWKARALDILQTTFAKVKPNSASASSSSKKKTKQKARA